MNGQADADVISRLHPSREVLGDTGARRKHDELEAKWRAGDQAQAAGAHPFRFGGGFSELFETFMVALRPILAKIALGAVVLAVLSALFLRTLRETESAPYRMRGEHRAGWTATLAPAGGAAEPLLLLAPPRELAMGLFQQVFERTMESMQAPAAYGIALILRREFDAGLAGFVEPEMLLALARETGLESAQLDPYCLAVRGAATDGDPRRKFYVLFDLPALHRFRTAVGRLLEERGGDPATFDPTAVAPALFIAATDGGFRGWPAAGGGAADRDCVAPIEME